MLKVEWRKGGQTVVGEQEAKVLESKPRGELSPYPRNMRSYEGIARLSLPYNTEGYVQYGGLGV